MEHSKCKENLSAYLDNELSGVERGLVEAHLAGCPDCRAEMDQLKAVSGIVKAHVMEPVPAALRRGVLAPAKRSSMPWFKPVLALSAAAAALLVVFNLTKTPEEVYSPSFGARERLEPLRAEISRTEEYAAPAAQAPSSPAASNLAAPMAADMAEADKKNESRPAVAAVRGSLAQAKFAARTAAPMAAGAGGAKGVSAEAPAEFTGPVCVYVSDPGVLREADRAMLDALAFLRKACPKTVQAAPGAVFVKKDGSRAAVSPGACSYGFILFDGLRDPQVVTDPSTVPAEFRKYFR